MTISKVGESILYSYESVSTETLVDTETGRVIDRERKTEKNEPLEVYKAIGQQGAFFYVQVPNDDPRKKNKDAAYYEVTLNGDIYEMADSPKMIDKAVVDAAIKYVEPAKEMAPEEFGFPKEPVKEKEVFKQEVVSDSASIKTPSSKISYSNFQEKLVAVSQLQGLDTAHIGHRRDAALFDLGEEDGVSGVGVLRNGFQIRAVVHDEEMSLGKSLYVVPKQCVLENNFEKGVTES